jgi:peptide/nickel transport system permease protein
VAAYIARRLIHMAPIVVLITMIVFIVMQLTPGNPMSAMISPDVPPAEILERERQLGLDRPLVVQYVVWLREVMAGNLGYSTKGGRPVSGLIASRLMPTLALAGTAIAVSFVIGVPVGVISAVRRYSALDYLLTVLAFIGLSVPNFFFAIGAIYVFAVTLDWLPPMGMATIASGYEGWALVVDRARHLVLPVAVLALSTIATVVRFTRSGMIEVLSADYVRTARSKGLNNSVVVYRHALRNALVPIITILGLLLPFLFSGSFIVEAIFAWPGLGQLGVQSIFSRDYPVVMAINLFAALSVLLGSLIADVLYGLADPRIRYE